LRNVNNDCCQNNTMQYFVTVFLCRYNMKTKTLTYSNGGHNLPYIVSKSSLSRLDGARGVILGLFENEEYSEETVQLKDGDTLFIYTDGITEARDENLREYGTERLEQILKMTDKGSGIINELSADMGKFCNGAPQSDDITVLTLICGKGDSNEITVPAEFSSFKDISKKCMEAVGEELSKTEDFFNLLTAIEEIFTNICSYAYSGGKGTLSFAARMTADGICECIISDSGMHFDPLKFHSEEHSEQSTDSLNLGGHGIYLAKALTDSLSYRYMDGRNILKIVKKINISGGTK